MTCSGEQQEGGHHREHRDGQRHHLAAGSGPGHPVQQCGHRESAPPRPRPRLDSEGGSVADISELIIVTLTRWGSALYNLVLVHMLLGNNSEHIFRAEADIPLEPTTSGRKIKSILGVICPSW